MSDRQRHRTMCIIPNWGEALAKSTITGAFPESVSAAPRAASSIASVTTNGCNAKRAISPPLMSPATRPISTAPARAGPSP